MEVQLHQLAEFILPFLGPSFTPSSCNNLHLIEVSHFDIFAYLLLVFAKINYDTSKIFATSWQILKHLGFVEGKKIEGVPMWYGHSVLWVISISCILWQNVKILHKEIRLLHDIKKFELELISICLPSFLIAVLPPFPFVHLCSHIFHSHDLLLIPPFFRSIFAYSPIRLLFCWLPDFSCNRLIYCCLFHSAFP